MHLVVASYHPKELHVAVKLSSCNACVYTAVSRKPTRCVSNETQHDSYTEYGCVLLCCLIHIEFDQSLQLQKVSAKLEDDATILSSLQCLPLSSSVLGKLV